MRRFISFNVSVSVIYGPSEEMLGGLLQDTRRFNLNSGPLFLRELSENASKTLLKVSSLSNTSPSLVSTGPSLPSISDPNKLI